MNAFTRVLKRLDIDSLVSYYLYGVEPFEKNAEDYTERLNLSYDELFAKMKELFPDIDCENEDLANAVSIFGSIHGEVHFQVGLLIGFRLYKRMEQGYLNLHEENLLNGVLKFIAPDGNWHKNDTSFLEDFLEKRMQEALEPSSVSNEQYQEALKKQKESLEQLEECDLNEEQREKVEQVLLTSQTLNVEYGKAAYKQGYMDAYKLLTELKHIQ